MATPPISSKDLEGDAQSVIPSRSESLQNARRALRKAQVTLASANLKFFKEANAIFGNKRISSDDALALMAECRISDNDITTICRFPAALGGSETLLRTKAVNFEVVKALVKTDNMTRQEALRRIETDEILTAKDVRKICKDRRDSLVPDDDLAQRERERRFRSVAETKAKAIVQDFNAKAKALLVLATENRDSERRLDDYRIDIERLGTNEELEKFESLDHSCSVEIPGVFSDARFALLTEQLMSSAQGLLVGFNDLFADEFPSFPSIEDWDVDKSLSVFQRLAQARYALEELGSSGSLPVISNDYYYWSAFDSIAYLAGERKFATYDRHRPRLVKKLTAIDLRAGVGATALGLEAAGFKLIAVCENDAASIATLKTNRPDWPVRAVDIAALRQSTSGAAVEQLEDTALTRRTMELLKKPTETTSASNNQKRTKPESLERPPNLITLESPDILCGGLPHRPWQRYGHGEDDKDDLFTTTQDVVRILKPKAFFFENVPDFDETRHLAFRQKLITDYKSMGYATDIWHLRASEFGIPQRRDRVFFVGIKKKYSKNLHKPVLGTPLNRDLREALGDVAFPYRTSGRGISPDEKMEKQARYNEWADFWLGEFGHKLTPELKNIDPRVYKRHVRDWENAGLSRGILSSEALKVDKTESTIANLEMTASLMRRIQGIPDDWHVAGSLEMQEQQICSSNPPVMARLVAHSIHRALTGEIIDLDKAAAAKIDSGRMPAFLGRGPKYPPGKTRLQKSDDPQMFRREGWKREMTFMRSVPRPQIAPEPDHV